MEKVEETAFFLALSVRVSNQFFLYLFSFLCCCRFVSIRLITHLAQVRMFHNFLFAIHTAYGGRALPVSFRRDLPTQMIFVVSKHYGGKQLYHEDDVSAGAQECPIRHEVGRHFEALCAKSEPIHCWPIKQNGNDIIVAAAAAALPKQQQQKSQKLANDNNNR